VDGHVLSGTGISNAFSRPQPVWYADAPNVVGLVYIAAFGLDEGESLGALLSRGPPTPSLVHQLVDKSGFVWLSEDDFVNHFAADIDAVKARVL
jgi:hypothetical protein